MSDPAADATHARLYLESHNDGVAVVTLPGTHYRLHLKCENTPDATPQGRIQGTIACDVWKLDDVDQGGAYIEPVYGRPRRVQGKVTATNTANNSVVLEVCGQPVVGLLPERWTANQLPIGETVALDVAPGASFLPPAS